ncbi:MAG: peptide deformylase [Desulfarculaceae bacterium]|nr:peptide deformylase [Desulfarculaceae bacterium]MCF8048154.1 peptide deformylase [Desulfarculaceae bacterium]MCF8065294.1 peptide deformylase [Desulfarculaceae bacterium]MCF8098823.1 peptide deformylase [Desulfarculaceae bacterium]MCF8123541.1 peptide deformylase [Desulfarculaceae bacterium]
MAVLPIKTFPDPVLSHPCRQVNEVDDDLRQLSQDMLDTMYAAPGVGLAAPQVGRDLRLVVIDCAPRDQDPQPLVLFNPRIVQMEGQVVFEEGCLSVPDFTCDVTRADRVVVKAMDAEGRPITVEGEGLMAVCLQHELDHLEGRLFLDRISPLKRSLYKKRRLKQIKRGDE